MNLQEMIQENISLGYSDENAQAKVCQDLILLGLSKSSLSRNATIKGGVVMRSISNNVRRATQDLDIDFIRYSLSDDSIKTFIDKINNIPEITITITGNIKKLKQQDYKGKRVFVVIKDETGYSIQSKIDLGVHKDLDIKQEEYCFDIAYFDDGANLLINSKEQMIIEKLRSLLRFKTLSTRYKDLFDIWFLLQDVDDNVLKQLTNKLIYQNKLIDENNKEELIQAIKEVYADKDFVERIKSSKKNWTNISEEEAIKETIENLNKFL